MSAASDAVAGFVAPDVPSDAIVNTCIKCGLCLPACPTYVLTLDERSSPRGRINLIGEVLEGRLPVDDPTFDYQMSECLGCRNCEAVCPSGVAFGALLEDARAQIVRRERPAFRAVARKAIYDLVLTDPVVARGLSAVVAFADLIGLRQAARAVGLVRALGLERLDSLLPTPHGRPFVARGQSWPAPQGSPRGTAALFVGCVMGALFGDVHRATVRVLASEGWRVTVPPRQGCCGALHLHAGYKEAARGLARRTIAAFEFSGASAVAVNAAGCGAMMKEYGALLEDDAAWADRAAAFSAKVKDATELLSPQETEWSSAGAVRVVYQDACHLAHAQRVKSQPRRAIDACAGVERAEMRDADRCCGSAGVYTIEHPKMADALADGKIAAAVDAGAQRIITANPGCQMQLAAASIRAGGPPVQHIMDFLDEPYAEPRAVIDRRHAATGGLLLGAGAIVIAGVAYLATRRER